MAYMELIKEAHHFIYIENQFFMSQNGGYPLSNQISEAIVLKIKEKARLNKKFKVLVIVPLLPGFEGDVETASVLKVQLHYQYQTICRGGQSIYEVLAKDPYIKDKASDYIQFCGLRNHGRIEQAIETEQIYVHSKVKRITLQVK